jgi:hypothetical protein
MQLTSVNHSSTPSIAYIKPNAFTRTMAFSSKSVAPPVAKPTFGNTQGGDFLSWNDVKTVFNAGGKIFLIALTLAGGYRTYNRFNEDPLVITDPVNNRCYTPIEKPDGVVAQTLTLPITFVKEIGAIFSDLYHAASNADKAKLLENEKTLLELKTTAQHDGIVASTKNNPQLSSGDAVATVEAYEQQGDDAVLTALKMEPCDCPPTKKPGKPQPNQEEEEE